MMTRLVQRAIIRGGMSLLGLVAVTAVLPAHEGYDYQCHDDSGAGYCHWGDGGDCAERQSKSADYCDMHGGISFEVCDEHGGMTACLS